MEVTQSDAEVWLGKLTKLLKHKDDLTGVQGVAMFKNRPIILPSLIAEVLDTLHSGHQESTSMQATAFNSVWWLGMTSDIKTRRKNC